MNFVKNVAGVFGLLLLFALANAYCSDAIMDANEPDTSPHGSIRAGTQVVNRESLRTVVEVTFEGFGDDGKPGVVKRLFAVEGKVSFNEEDGQLEVQTANIRIQPILSNKINDLNDRTFTSPAVLEYTRDFDLDVVSDFKIRALEMGGQKIGYFVDTERTKMFFSFVGELLGYHWARYQDSEGEDQVINGLLFAGGRFNAALSADITPTVTLRWDIVSAKGSLAYARIEGEAVTRLALIISGQKSQTVLGISSGTNGNDLYDGYFTNDVPFQKYIQADLTVHFGKQRIAR